MTIARKTMAMFGPARGRVRVFVERGGELIRVQWYEQGRLRKRSWPNTPDGRAEAKAWAKGFAEARGRGTVRVPDRLTLRALWERYAEAEFPHLRLKTQTLYVGYWRKWELFLGREFIAEDARLEHLDQLRNALRRRAIAVGHVERAIRLVKTVYGWAERREHLVRNRLAGYRFKRAKDERDVPPAEYSVEERERLTAALSPHRADQWRPWVAMRIAGHQGARMNAILHLQWADVDLEARSIVWRVRWDKTGREWRQPLTEAAAGALGIAWVWRERDSYAGPWVFYSSHARKRAMGEDPRAVYHPTALLRALGLAETRAGVTHRPYRGMHGFRRAVAGDVARATGNLKLAMEYIGDTDIRRSREYIQVRPDHLKEAASVMDRARPNRTQTVPEAGAASEPGPELVAAGGTAELPRQDSNLRPAG